MVDREVGVDQEKAVRREVNMIKTCINFSFKIFKKQVQEVALKQNRSNKTK